RAHAFVDRYQPRRPVQGARRRLGAAPARARRLGGHARRDAAADELGRSLLQAAAARAAGDCTIRRNRAQSTTMPGFISKIFSKANRKWLIGAVALAVIAFF